MSSVRYILTAAVAAVLSFGPAWAQADSNPVRTTKESERLVPRLFKKPVKSLTDADMNVLDTIETQSPGVKILLYGNNTWKYFRDPSMAAGKKVYTENWETGVADPYHVGVGDLPDKISIWVVDTLNQYRCPQSKKVFSPFGYRWGYRHQGVDIPLNFGDPVYAAFDGRVRLSQYYYGYGNLVILRHENGLETYYAHLSQRKVEVGDWVSAGQVVGLGGSTGFSTGPHLHFETRYQGYAFDPEWLIDFESGELRHRLFVLKKRYITDGSKYVPDSEDEEKAINTADARDYARADSIAAAKQEEARRAAAAAAAAAAAMRYHKIRSGDTLSGIAKRYGTTVGAICRLNAGLTSKTVLKIGRTIRVK